MDVNDDIRAAIITANIKPRAPSGIKFSTSFGYAMSVHPLAFPQIFLQIAGSAQPTSSTG
jgi:hypothetical protein